MGNSCAKGARPEPHQSVAVARYPTGLPRPEKSPSSAPESVPAASSDPLKAKKHKEEKRYTQPSCAIERPMSIVNKKNQVLPGCKNVKCFCYGVLRNATRKFCDKNLLGQGGFGDVYKGWIGDCYLNTPSGDGGVAVAVKRLRKTGLCGDEEWMVYPLRTSDFKEVRELTDHQTNPSGNEITFLSRLSHPNIVKLVGCCCDGGHRILVYEYMPRGSLESHLLGERETLNWSRRIKIAIGTAKGLNYLHTHGVPVIHRDIKTSNVLLDKEFNPKLSDFGLAKCGPQGDKTHITTRVLGTHGYFAPEYVATGHLTLKTDIYSFGVVLLELLTGSGAIKKYSDGVGNIAQCAKPYLNPMLLHCVIDKKLQWKYRKEEAQQFASIILRCLHSEAKSRPTITQVVADLEQLQKNTCSCH